MGSPISHFPILASGLLALNLLVAIGVGIYYPTVGVKHSLIVLWLLVVLNIALCGSAWIVDNRVAER